MKDYEIYSVHQYLNVMLGIFHFLINIANLIT